MPTRGINGHAVQLFERHASSVSAPSVIPLGARSNGDGELIRAALMQHRFRSGKKVDHLAPLAE